jgi:hypothetical protein
VKRIAIALAATLVVMSVVIVAGAAGHTARYDSTVTIKFNKPKPNDPYSTATFDGTVKSTKPRCEKNRAVTVRMRTADGSNPAVGTDVTDQNGVWVVTPSSSAPGTYFAQVAKKVLKKNAKHRHICRKAVSKDVTVK